MGFGCLLRLCCFEQMKRFLQAEKASIHINLIFSSVFGNRNYVSNTMAADPKSLNN